ncbi:MAG TPA: DUF177 domain-containing protein [Dehalococcoidia bacterium]|nr:DUF177 domain-containing protein [Dehalococcoidia bacterium]
MQFNVAQLLKEVVGSTRSYQVGSDLQMDGEVRHVSGSLEMIRTDAGILVRAEVVVPAEAECSRCLSPVPGRKRLILEEEFLPTVDVVSGTRVNRDRDPEAFTIDENHILDVSEAIRQYWVLAEPMHPLCKETCAGLCAICGRNRNIERCDCRTDDERWSTLAELAGALRESERS